MQFRKEPCRNFQRGHCQYGERCKFLHVTQQQPKSNNVFGFGTQAGSQQQPQQKPNPFGFGVQNNSQPKGANNFGNKQNQYKPFENKWSRFSPLTNNSAPSAKQPDNQPQPGNHDCTDPEACKRIIAEDFEHERPLWKLTCYSHWKRAPCDIVGDISYEELRATAYDDAKRGLSLQSIVERERNLLNSKLVEFDNLLRNPYRGPANSGLASRSSFPVATQNAFSPNVPANPPPSVSSFGQLGSSLNIGPPATSNNAFGQPKSNNAFGQPKSNNAFGQPNASQSSNAFGANNLASATAGSFNSQLATQANRSSFTPNTANFGGGGIMSGGSNPFSTQASSTNNSTAFSFGNPAHIQPSVPVSSANLAGQATTNIQLMNNLQSETNRGDSSVWLKEKWMPGEIPEEAPPEAYV